MYAGTKIALPELLVSREQRALRQLEWLNSYSTPLISFTINMVGEVKNNHIARVAFEAGLKTIEVAMQDHQLTLVAKQAWRADTGLEALIAVEDGDVQQLKNILIGFEQSHPLGRLFDLDVIDLSGRPVSRIEFSLPPRKCLVCSKDAKICARSRRHTLEEIIQTMSEMINEYSPEPTTVDG